MLEAVDDGPPPGSAGFAGLVEAHLRSLGTRKPSPHTMAAYRRDLAGVATRLAEGLGLEASQLSLEHLSKASLRQAFSSWATDHAGASVTPG